MERLNQHDNFRGRSSWIQRIFSASPCGHPMLIAPKCHLATCTRHTRSSRAGPGRRPLGIRRNCRQTITSLRLNSRQALKPENFPLPLMPKWFRKMRDYMKAYETLGAAGMNADRTDKQCK